MRRLEVQSPRPFRSSTRLSRRQFVQGGALVAGALSVPAFTAGCGQPQADQPAPAKAAADQGRFHLVTLDPGHFHAALVQKSMYPDVSPVVHVYAEGRTEADAERLAAELSTTVEQIVGSEVTV